MALDWKKTSKWWYARFSDTSPINLGIEIKGRRPLRIRDDGPGVDPVFVQSRGRALEAHDRLQSERTTKNNQQHLLEKLIEIKTGSAPTFQRLSTLTESWKAIERAKPLSKSYERNCTEVLDAFVEFMSRVAPKVRELAQVTADHMAEFMRLQSDQGIAPATISNPGARTFEKHSSARCLPSLLGPSQTSGILSTRSG